MLQKNAIVRLLQHENAAILTLQEHAEQNVGCIEMPTWIM